MILECYLRLEIESKTLSKTPKRTLVGFKNIQSPKVKLMQLYLFI